MSGLITHDTIKPIIDAIDADGFKSMRDNLYYDAEATIRGAIKAVIQEHGIDQNWMEIDEYVEFIARVLAAMGKH